jgi:mycothiol system anti-sigma-R factor
MSYFKPPKHDCSQVMQRLYVFIDHELADADAQAIQQHLDECAPCLDAVAYEQLVRAVVARSCVERAPVSLRQRVIFSIRQEQHPLEGGPLDLE